MLWGEDHQESLKTKSIAIIGAGGLGCSNALALSGSGIGKIYIVDFDRVEIHNIHRQIGFTSSDIGEYKAKVLSKLLKNRNPDIKTFANVMEFNEFKKDAPKLDLIIDATDNMKTRVDINNFAKEQDIPWVYGSVEEFKGYVALFKDKSYSIFDTKEKEPAGIAAPMVMHIASLQSNLALRYLLDLSVSSDLLYYIYFDKDGILKNKSFKI